jgi:hypothetical protein
MKVHAPGKIRDGKIRDVKASKGQSVSNGTGRKQTLPFYVAPSKRYYYWTPKSLATSRRNAKTDPDAEAKKRKRGHVGRLGERTSPFPSFWYCGLGEGFQTEALRWHRKLPRAMVDGYAVASHPNDLPLHVLDEWDPRREKLMAAARLGESSWRNGGKDGRDAQAPAASLRGIFRRELRAEHAREGQEAVRRVREDGRQLGKRQGNAPPRGGDVHSPAAKKQVLILDAND